MIRLIAIPLAWFVLAQSAAAQETTSSTPVDAAATAPSGEPAVTDESSEDKWAISLAAYIYSVPDDRDYLQPTLALDYQWLHLEGRYNYEDFDTGSAWVGYNVHLGDEDGITFDFTPIAGVVFGDTEGVAPGYEFTLWWKGFSLYSEGEYVFDTNDSSESFFYTWSELTFAPVDWLRIGWADQLTKIRGDEVFDENGPMIGVTYKNLDWTLYLLNIDDSTPTVIVGFEFAF